MNEGAIELYASHGIDLYTERLEIAVCAQHCNGGVTVDGNWQTEIEGLYAAGEAAGTFGVYRPGGSALNSTQVGSLRAAEHISKKGRRFPESAEYTLPEIKYGESNVASLMRELQHEMSCSADFDRCLNKMRSLFDKVSYIAENFFDIAVIGDKTEISLLFKLRDTVYVQQSVLSAMICSAEKIGSHGSAFVDRSPIRDEGVRRTRTVTRGEVSHLADVSPLPDGELWFETLLAKTRK